MYGQKMKKSRKAILVLFDSLCLVVVSALYYLATQMIATSVHYELFTYINNTVILLGAMILSRLVFRIYVNVWRYPSTLAYLKMIFADTVGGIVAVFVSFFTGFFYDVWFFVIVSALCALLCLITRFFYRLLYKHHRMKAGGAERKIPVAIIGAGQLGVCLVDELNCNQASPYRPVFFIDRDATKAGSMIVGLRVYSESDFVAVERAISDFGVHEIFIAIEQLDSSLASALYERYSKLACKVKIYDVSFKSANGSGSESGGALAKGTLHDFRIEDLLFRESLSINNSATDRYYTGKRVLVTGGGGSIGSELCRQIAKCQPEQLIIVDIYENNAYDIQQELIRKYGERLNLIVEIASVRDRVRLEAIFNRYRPNIVFHAAAHKHVPLMEHSACEAIKNNVLGTYNTADMAEKYHVQKFILISTDKAVNPTNVMGASKRMCEMVVQCRNEGNTEFAAVRFGNVLGSNGSVIPLFRHQIAEGGPITITDKRIIRYFMTVPEATQLVIEAGAMAKKGELFVLDMGKPVRIYDLAVNMIRLCGLRPDIDIEIKEIGLRPGEKLYEELLIKTETLTKTDNSMIFIETDTPLSREAVDAKIKRLVDVVNETQTEISPDAIKAAFKEVVPTFLDPEEVNQKASDSEEMQQALAGTK